MSAVSYCVHVPLPVGRRAGGWVGVGVCVGVGRWLEGGCEGEGEGVGGWVGEEETPTHPQK